ncbi:MAG: enoyl-CoA hydratase/isomerase family protein [Candidatus Binatia bacterium]
MGKSFRTLLMTREGPGIVCVTLNRPERLNALNGQLVDDLHACLGTLETDPDAAVVLLRGAGRAFCAGLDLKEPSGDPAGRGDQGIAAALRGQRHISSLILKMRHLPQPIIALVHGAAAGGGFGLALAADVRIAGESARMNAAFIRLGFSACDVGTSYFLPRIAGLSLASELLLTGKFIDAHRALASGLVSRVVPDEELDAAGKELACEMTQNAPLSLRLTKECLLHSVDAGSLEAAIAIEDRNQSLSAQSPNVREGIRAFLEKRPPRWRD